MGAKIVGVAEQGNSIQGDFDIPVFDGKPINDERNGAAYERSRQAR